jgi:hypothetical protein
VAVQDAVSRRQTANEHYSILSACARIGMDVEASARARKIYCPFGNVFHSDGGDEPAMRVYEDSNHAYCFACRKYFTPSILIAMAEDIPEDRAVDSMLLELGYIKTDTGERWEAASAESTVNTAALAEALHIAAARIITPWSVRQYDADVVEWMSKCLALLGKVETVEQGETWLDVTKKVLQHKFGSAQRKEGQ